MPCRPSGLRRLELLSWLLLEQCRRASIDTADRSHSGGTAVDDVAFDAVDDDDGRRIADDDLEQSGSGDGASRRWLDAGAFSDAALPGAVTTRWLGRPTPLLLSVHRFIQAGDVDVAVTTRRTAAASSSTSWRSVTSLVTSLVLAHLTSRTRSLVLIICD